MYLTSFVRFFCWRSLLLDCGEDSSVVRKMMLLRHIFAIHKQNPFNTISYYQEPKQVAKILSRFYCDELKVTPYQTLKIYLSENINLFFSFILFTEKVGFHHHTQSHWKNQLKIDYLPQCQGNDVSLKKDLHCFKLFKLYKNSLSIFLEFSWCLSFRNMFFLIM